jgi:hypothetical protein
MGSGCFYSKIGRLFFVNYLSTLLVTEQYFHISGLYVTNKMGFGYDDRVHWTFIFVTTVQKSLSDKLTSFPVGQSTGTVLTSN